MASKIIEERAFANLRWQDGAEPPDFDLFIDDVEYAIEITEMRKLLEVGRMRLPFGVIGRDLEAFVRRAESALLASGEFIGEYAVDIPRQIPDLMKLESELVTLIRGAIADLRDVPLGIKVPIGGTAATFEPYMSGNPQSAHGAATTRIEDQVSIPRVRATERLRSLSEAVRGFDVAASQMEGLVVLIARSRKVDLDIISTQVGALIATEIQKQLRQDLSDLDETLSCQKKADK